MGAYPFKVDSARCVLPQAALQLIIAVVFLTTSTGCGQDDWQVKTYPASGRVTINGQAPEGAVVTLHPVGQKVDQRGSNPWGIVQADGTYSLSTYKEGDGAPTGQYAVTIRWPLDVTDMAAAMTDRLGGAYSSEEQSQWKVAIEPQENELSPIDIQGAKVQSERDAKPNRRAPPAMPTK